VLDDKTGIEDLTELEKGPSDDNLWTVYRLCINTNYRQCARSIGKNLFSHIQY